MLTESLQEPMAQAHQEATEFQYLASLKATMSGRNLPLFMGLCLQATASTGRRV
jgi:hypothetical protein